MRVTITVPHIAKESTGPSYTVPALCRGLAREGAEVELHTLIAPKNVQYGFPVRCYPHSRLWPLRRLGWSLAMKHGLARAVKDSDILHMNGIWLLPNVYPSQAARGTTCKVVCCPRGGLSKVTFSRGWLIKWLMWHLGGQKRALQEVAMFHAASEKELAEIRAAGFRQPVAVIPNGIDVPQIERKDFIDTNRKLVFFGRIHPTKAADRLLAAWGRLAHSFPEWSLEIAGPDCGAVSMLKSMIVKHKIPRVSLVGELHGIDKYRFLSSSDLYVLPSMTENFGITIAEALVCGTPVVASKGCPWERLQIKGCGWWVDNGVDALTNALQIALALSPSDLKAMGERGRAWMQDEYSWNHVAEQMMLAYKWLLNCGDRPSYVY